MPQTHLAEQLVQTHIKGFRKGTSDVPNWTHSFQVRDCLLKHRYSEEVSLAGLLHDIVEDGDVTFDELRAQGFSERIIELIDLCSHDPSLPADDGRWVKMLARLVDAQDKDAWAIKLADITDNLRSCHTMSEGRQRFMYETKGPLLLSLTWKLMGDTGIWKELQDQIKQRP
jgi:(p)ppGpp synthase/HD superfamily hydrolase